MSAIIGISAGLFYILISIAIDVVKTFINLKFSEGLAAVIISIAIMVGTWYLISRRLYSEDKNILFISFLILIIISIVSLNFGISLMAIGPRGEQIPMYALIFRGYEMDGKKVVYAPWEEYDWSFYKPYAYKEKFSRKYNERIYIASFYYQEKQEAEKAFEDYKTLFVLNRFIKSNFDVNINRSERFELIDSFAFEDSYFIYSEFIETKKGYLPGYYILIIKSNIDEKQVVKLIVEQEEQ